MIIGHAAVFNQLSEDLGGFREQVAPGAFVESIAKDDIRALFNHDSNVVLGRNLAKTLRLVEDEMGLAVEIDPPATTAARDIITAIERGDVSGMSIGFTVRPNGSNWGQDDDGNWVRTITAAKLWDVSPVTFPAYPQTDVALREWARARESRDNPSHRGAAVGLLRRRLALCR